MLVRLTVSNFKSFNDITDFNMLSSNKTRDHQDHKVKIKQTVLLKHSVIYGANAAGKSNLIDVLYFFKEVLMNGLPLESDDLFCKNYEDNIRRPSEFELQFTVGDKFYAYGFSVLLNKREIQKEWLYELLQSGSANCIYERAENERAIMGNGIRMSENETTRFNIYAEDFVGNNEELFLTEVNRNKKINENSRMHMLVDIFNWLIGSITIIYPESNLIDFNYYDEASLSKISFLLKSFDTGIEKVLTRRITFEEFSKMVPAEKIEEIKQVIKENLNHSEKVNISFRINDTFVNYTVSKDMEPVIEMIYLKHRHSKFDFQLSDESEGTKRIFELLDLVLSKNNNVYIVDELERSLHPKLTEHFLKIFEQEHANDKTQLIFATHEANIMDLKLFRRDEIWFVERNENNDSKLYSLDKFNERCDKVLSKSYLEGRYGAIPVLSSVLDMEV